MGKSAYSKSTLDWTYSASSTPNKLILTLPVVLNSQYSGPTPAENSSCINICANVSLPIKNFFLIPVGTQVCLILQVG